MVKNLKSHLALLGANTIYGLNYVISKGIMPDYLMPRAIVFLRILVTVVIFGILNFFITPVKVERRDLFKLALCAVLGVAINQILFFEGLNLTTPINASIIITVIPVLIIIFSRYILKEKISAIKVVGIVLGASGAIMVILSEGKVELRSGSMLGNLLIFLNASSWALYLVLIKPLMEKYDTFTVMKWIFFFGLIIITPLTITSFTSSSFVTIPFKIWMSITFVIFGATIAAYFLNNFALKSLTPNVSGIYIYLQPLIASVVAILFGKDELTLMKTLAALLIMAGVYFVTRRKKNNTSLLPS